MQPKGGVLDLGPGGQASLGYQRYIGPFALGLFSFLHVETVGELYLNDVVVLGLSFLALLIGLSSEGPPRGMNMKDLRFFVLGGMLYLYAEVVGGLASRPFEGLELLKAALNVGLMVAALAGVAYVLRGDQARARLHLLGIAIGSILGFVLQPNPYAAEYPWKFGLALPTSILVLLALSHVKASVHALASILGGLSAVNFVLGYRSMSVILMATLALSVISRTTGTRGSRGGSKRVLIALALIAVSTVVLIRTYDSLAASGKLGDQARIKLSIQADGGMGTILGARPEIYYMTAHAASHILIGDGPEPRYTAADLQRVDVVLDRLGASRLNRDGVVENAPMRQHSHLLTGWLQAGIAGLLFWVFAVSFCIRTLLSIDRVAVIDRPLVAFLAVDLVWDILFSPFGASRRFTVATVLVTLMILKQWGRKEEVSASEGRPVAGDSRHCETQVQSCG